MKRLLVALGAVALFVVTFYIRTRGISEHFWLGEDQWRDWEFALQPLWNLPLVGSPTHVHGYAIGPAFYWILWAIRVTIGPFFDNLPHAGGIGQAFLATTADVLLMFAVWRRTKSPWVALTGFILIASSPFDLSLSALVWNPTMGETLVKFTMAMVLFGWHRRSMWTMAVTAIVAWAALHAYTGAVFATTATLALLAFSTDWRVMARRALLIAGVVAVMQVPYGIYRFKHRNAEVMSAVSGGVAQILTGKAKADIVGSARGYVESVGSFQEVTGWQWPAALLIVSALVLLIRDRRDPELIWLLLVPQALAVIGFALFLGALDSYYYLSLLPISVLTVAIALMPRTGKAAMAIGLVVTLAAAWLVPTRMYHSHLFELPEYGVIVAASRTLRDQHRPLRAIRVSFPLPPNVNVAHPYFAMGGLFDPKGSIVATINRDGSISY